MESSHPPFPFDQQGLVAGDYIAKNFKGKKVGVWDFGNEFEVTAAAKKAAMTGVPAK